MMRNLYRLTRKLTKTLMPYIKWNDAMLAYHLSRCKILPGWQ